MHATSSWVLALGLALCVVLPRGASAQEGDPAPDGFHFVIHEGGKSFVVLTTQADEAWTRGGPHVARRVGPTVVWRRAPRHRLPAELRAALVGRYTLRNQAGVRCVASLGRTRVMHRAEGVDYLYDLHGEANVSDQRLARDVEGATRGFLVAEVTRPRGRCAGATWALRRGVTPDLGVAVGHADDDEVRGAFRGLASFAELQAAWDLEREYAGEGSQGIDMWDDRPDAAFAIRRFRSADGREFALATAYAYDGCGDFTGGLWALFEQRDGGLALVGESRSGDFSADALIDVDRDGVPELLSGVELARVLPTGETRSVSVEVDYLGCPC